MNAFLRDLMILVIPPLSATTTAAVTALTIYFTEK